MLLVVAILSLHLSFTLIYPPNYIQDMLIGKYFNRDSYYRRRGQMQ